MADTQERGQKKFDSPGHYTKKDRESIPDSDFGDAENKLYPIVVPQDVEDSGHLIGKAGNPAAVKARIKAIAKRKGPAFVAKIPDSWNGEDDGRSGEPDTFRNSEDDVITRFSLPGTMRREQDRRAGHRGLRESNQCAPGKREKGVSCHDSKPD